MNSPPQDPSQDGYPRSISTGPGGLPSGIYSDTRVDVPDPRNLPADEAAGLPRLRAMLAESSGRLLAGDPLLAEFASDDCLLRYLRAKKRDVGAAHTMLLASLKWRAQHEPQRLLDPAAVASQMGAGSNYVHGFDGFGHPVVYVRAARESPGTFEEKLDLLVCVTEEACRAAKAGPEGDGGGDANGVEKVVYIIDLAGFKMAGPGADPRLANTWLNIFQNHYTERYFRVFVINCPAMFSGLWSVIKVFIDPATRKKMIFVTACTPDRLDKDIAKLFTADMLEEPYGRLPQLINDAQSREFRDAHAPPKKNAWAPGKFFWDQKTLRGSTNPTTASIKAHPNPPSGFLGCGGESRLKSFCIDAQNRFDLSLS